MKKLLSQGDQHLIYTPNPEMCVEAHRNKYFRDILNSSTLNLCDGFGTFLMGRFLYRLNLERVTGVDFFEAICEQLKAKIFLLGAAPGVAKQCQLILEKKYPHLKIVGTFSGKLDSDGIKEIEKEIKKTAPEILFTAFGAPKQEIFLFENLSRFPSVKVGVGVGGTFDFISRKQKRAPLFLRRLGLEWLFRLAREPRQRLIRIWRATVVFSFLVFREKIMLERF